MNLTGVFQLTVTVSGVSYKILGFESLVKRYSQFLQKSVQIITTVLLVKN